MRSTASQDIQTASGWLYLAAVIDLYSRNIVGYSLSNRMTADLVCTALQIVIYARQPPTGLIMHTDRGSQYCSQQYQDLLTQHGIVCSMSHKGLCYDNAVMERFFLNLKMERVWQYEQYIAQGLIIKKRSKILVSTLRCFIIKFDYIQR